MPSCLIGTNGAPRLMISCSACAQDARRPRSSASALAPAPRSRPRRRAARRGRPRAARCRSRSRSGIRAASTWTFSSTMGRSATSASPLAARNPYRQRPMAVATEREYGLFINGEPASRRPASSRARRARDRRAARRGRRWRARRTSTARSTPRARRSTGDWGKTPPTERSRLLHALADAIVANRKELAELEARNVGKAISSVKAELAQAVENFRFYASAIALDRRPLEPDRRLAALLLAEGAGRRLRPDRAVELPADDDDVEARACARGGLHGRAQARPRRRR